MNVVYLYEDSFKSSCTGRSAPLLRGGKWRLTPSCSREGNVVMA